MPRKKTDNVTEHRVTLGDWERKHIELAQLAKSIKDVGTGVGIGAVGIGGTIVAYKIGKSIYGWTENGIGDELLKAVGVDPDQAKAFADSDVLSENAPVGNPLYRITLKILGL